MLHHTHQGLSQRDLARIVGVDPGSVSKWEAGDRIPGEWTSMFSLIKY
ncbi:MAG: helix-turn-helix transcriptional regulator [Candidatus Thiodiazotropha sp.]